MKNKITETVPLDPSFGGITDGEWICVRCKKEKVGCALCAGMPIALVPAPENVNNDLMSSYQWSRWNKS